MAKRAYNVTLDTNQVDTFKSNNISKLSTLLNDLLKKFNDEQIKALDLNQEIKS